MSLRLVPFLLALSVTAPLSVAELAGDNSPVEAAIGLAREKSAIGEYAAAEKILTDAAKRHLAAALDGELAELTFARGDYDAARGHVERALKIDDRQLAARWVKAELARVSGKLDEAEAGYKWFIDYYNASDKIDDPRSLHWIGLAAAQHARWKRASDQFDFLVNELYPDALKLDANYWPAHLETGRLFLEKYNFPEALKSFDAALAINPNAAEVHAAKAAAALDDFDLAKARRSISRALQINPNLLWARQLRADALAADFQIADAIRELEAARKLNPVAEETLGRLAACYAALDGFKLSADSSRLGKLIDEVNRRNPRAGGFYAAMGEALDRLRKYPDAAACHEEAMRRMPRLLTAGGQLGLVYMRLGDEAKASKLLAQSFQDDPFNVRVKNMLAVLDVLAGYTALETKHFVIKFDRGRDDILARCAVRYLESDVYPQVTKQLGHEPRGKTLIEIFSRAKNTGGHGWFSARMVGLPYVGTVGACAGKMIAIASPNDTAEKYNWARVLKHEFVHVVNLQQTDFNVPHWCTEALAVRSEPYARPAAWDELLRQRFAAGELFDLTTLNHGFARPKSSADWQLAYCQAALYADYIVEHHGEAAIGKLLAAYANRKNTAESIEQVLKTTPAEFEKGYRQYLETVTKKRDKEDVKSLKSEAAKWLSAGDESKLTPVLEQLAHREPDRPTYAAKLAQLALAKKDFAAAERWADRALSADVMDAESHRMAAESRIGRGKLREAIEHYEMATRLAPKDTGLWRALAQAYRDDKQPAKARQADERAGEKPQ